MTPDIMAQTEAAVCLLNATKGYNHGVNVMRETFVFLSLFNPELSMDERLELAQDAGREANRRIGKRDEPVHL